MLSTRFMRFEREMATMILYGESMLVEVGYLSC